MKEEDEELSNSQRKSTRQSKRQTKPKGRPPVGGRGAKSKAANQSPAAAENLENAGKTGTWQMLSPSGIVFEFTVMEYGGLGEIPDEESVEVPDVQVKEENLDIEQDPLWNDIVIKNEVKEELTEEEVKKEKPEVRDFSVQVSEETRESASQAIAENADCSSQVIVETHNAATGTSFVNKTAEVQACIEVKHASTGSETSYATTQDAATNSIQTVLKDASTATVRRNVLFKDAEATADIPVKNTGAYGHNKSAQTALKGWQSASLDVSVQQSNGSFRVQSLDVGADDTTINRPLRVWFPPSGKDVVCQTDIKGWVDTHMDVITQGEDGSYYLKKSVEHGALPTDLVYRPYRVHRAIQATWVGNQTFHMATQTKWDGSSTFHKATQCPDPQKSEEQMGQSVLYTLDKGCPVGLTPTITPFTSAPTVTSLLATLGLPSTEDPPVMPVMQTPIMSSIASATSSMSTVSSGVQPMDLDTDDTPTSIVENRAPSSSAPSSSMSSDNHEPGQGISTMAPTGSEGERVITPSIAANSVMSFAGYNQFAMHGANPFGPFVSQAGTIPMQQYAFIPQYPPGMPPGYNFYPGWM